MRLVTKKDPNKSTDNKGLIAHFKGLTTAKSGIYTGIHADAHDYADGTDVMTVAMVGEFGNASNNIPPRHFLSRSISIDKAYYQNMIFKTLATYTFKDNAQFIEAKFREIGRQSVKLSQSHIEKNSIGMTPNTPATANRKGGNQPMIDTGHLVQQIDYKLEDIK